MFPSSTVISQPLHKRNGTGSAIKKADHPVCIQQVHAWLSQRAAVGGRFASRPIDGLNQLVGIQVVPDTGECQQILLVTPALWWLERAMAGRRFSVRAFRSSRHGSSIPSEFTDVKYSRRSVPAGGPSPSRGYLVSDSLRR